MKIHSMELGRVHEGNFRIYRPNGSGDYLFLYVRCQAGIVLEGQDQVLPAGSLIIFPAGAAQNYYSVSDIYVNDYIHFELERGDTLSMPPFELPLNQIITLPPEISIDRMLELIYTQYISQSKRKEIIIGHLMNALFLLIADISSVLQTDANVSGYYRQLQTLRKEIYQNPAQLWTVASMAEQMQLSASYFQKLYRDTFHISCYNDVIISKIHYAKTLLATSDYSVKAIAAMCGYENDVHFMRQFKKLEGKTPSQYRKGFFGGED